jgi:hypothetical protein
MGEAFRVRGGCQGSGATRRRNNMITLLLAGVVEDPDPDAMWTMAAIELLFEAFGIIVLVGLVVW